ncbi:MAG TPA: TonB-dependent receptor [Lacunisphaera sp.]|nr:TonB-dependent receptor [Lacunisphaera sp.]
MSRYSHTHRFPRILLLAFFLAPFPSLFAQRNADLAPVSSLKQMSLEELMDLEVTSVSRRAEKLTEVASAIQVVTGDDIRRSAATNLTEALRLAPNLQAAQLNSCNWIIGARGFNGDFANKLLVMIDGRSVYTPLFAGVLWDVQQPLLEDIDRIEVVSGPGGSLWGANAVNGVINVLTKHARETQGTYLSTTAGSALEGAGAIRHGGRVGENVFFRVYAHAFDRDHSFLPNGQPAADSWRFAQGGFRLDYHPSSATTFTLQGDAYDGTEQTAPAESTLSGGNLLGRWTRSSSSGSALSVQVYYDRTKRHDVPSTLTDDLTTFDLDLSHGFDRGSRHHFLWGLGIRLMRDEVIASTPFVGILPPRRDLKLYSGFLQDEISFLDDRLRLTLGSKFEHNSFSGFDIQPSVRLAFTPAEGTTLWTAVSRAVRTPSRFDKDYYLPKDPPFAINGGPNFDSEQLLAFEAGGRFSPRKDLTLSVSAYLNEYRDLYNVQTTTFPLTIENGAEGRSWGVEISGTWQPASGWRLRGGYNYFEKELGSKPGHVAAPNVLASLGRDPQHQFSLHSMFQLRAGLELDITARYVSALAEPRVPAYATGDVRLAWTRGAWEISVVGQNLADRRHAEFGTLYEIPRSGYGKVVWRF